MMKAESVVGVLKSLTIAEANTKGLFDQRDKEVKLIRELANKHGAHKFDIGLRQLAIGFATPADAKAFVAELKQQNLPIIPDEQGRWAYVIPKE